MIRRSGQRGVPVITVDDQVIVGFDQPRLQQALAAAKQSAPRSASSRPRLGASIADAARISQQQGQVPTLGAYIGKVTPNSPASLAGLESGDIVTEINLRRIASAADMQEALGATAAGSNLDVVFLRGGQPIRTRVKL
jgi:S1-C subfamily serine protease